MILNINQNVELIGEERDHNCLGNSIKGSSDGGVGVSSND